LLGFDPMFNLMQTIIPIIFLFVLSMILLQIFRGLKQWNANNKQPILTVDAKIVTKRTHVSRHAHSHQNHVHHHTSTKYFMTFEFESTDRLELMVNDTEYGQLVEGDTGKLTFQGTRFLGFDRKK
jgi:hypothetical protein